VNSDIRNVNSASANATKGIGAEIGTVTAIVTLIAVGGIVAIGTLVETETETGKTDADPRRFPRR
jgi:hypothetical protein